MKSRYFVLTFLSCWRSNQNLHPFVCCCFFLILAWSKDCMVCGCSHGLHQICAVFKFIIFTTTHCWNPTPHPDLYNMTTWPLQSKYFVVDIPPKTCMVYGCIIHWMHQCQWVVLEIITRIPLISTFQKGLVHHLCMHQIHRHHIVSQKIYIQASINTRHTTHRTALEECECSTYKVRSWTESWDR